MPLKPRCTEIAGSGKWRIGTTGKGNFDDEESCLEAWEKMNGGSGKGVFKPIRRSRARKEAGRKTTIPRRAFALRSRRK